MSWESYFEKARANMIAARKHNEAEARRFHRMAAEGKIFLPGDNPPRGKCPWTDIACEKPIMDCLRDSQIRVIITRIIARAGKRAYHPNEFLPFLPGLEPTKKHHVELCCLEGAYLFGKKWRELGATYEIEYLDERFKHEADVFFGLVKCDG